LPPEPLALDGTTRNRRMVLALSVGPEAEASLLRRRPLRGRPYRHGTATDVGSGLGVGRHQKRGACDGAPFVLAGPAGGAHGFSDRKQTRGVDYGRHRSVWPRACPVAERRLYTPRVVGRPSFVRWPTAVSGAGAVALWVSTSLLVASTLVIMFLPRSTTIRQGPFGLAVAGGFVFMLVTSTVGALVAARRPANPIGWLFSTAALTWAVMAFASEYSLYALFDGPGSLPAGEWFAWLSSWVFLAAGAPGFFVALLLFPDGRVLGPRWRVLMWAVIVSTLLYAAGLAFAPDVIETPWFPIANPMGRAGLQVPTTVRLIGVFATGACFVLTAVSLLVRLARSRGLQRQQLKFVAYVVVCCALLASIIYAAAVLGFGSGFMGFGYSSNSPVAVFVLGVVTLVLAAIPVAVGMAILQHGLYEIDLLINRTLVYGMLTATLLVLYWLSVLVLQRLLNPVTQGSDVAIAASTLGVAAAFQPIRQRVQRLVDQRFYRRKYDAARALAAFTATLRNVLDLERLTSELVSFVSHTVQPRAAWLWSPAVDGSWRARESAEHIGPTDPLLGALREAGGVVEVQRLGPPSAALELLKTSGAQVAVPLVSQAQLVGVLALGPRRSEAGYNADDRALLENLAGQAAPALRLAQVVEQRQVELQQHERLEQELRIARLIQQALLPTEPPRLDGWQVAAHYEAAHEVGGDFYDFLRLPDGRLGLAIGDVSGNGIPAALIMATTHSILRAAAASGASPGEVLAQANAQLEHRLPANMFVTCQYLVLEPDSGVLRYANAGHVPAMWCHAKRVDELALPGLPLGVQSGTEYLEADVRLGPSDTVLLYSDGLVEARNASGELFGFERLAELLASAIRTPDPRALIRTELANFRGSNVQPDDDVTLMILQRMRDTGLPALHTEFRYRPVV
jgi:serine phosphatase RsbU (regulator of sigma subunit)